MRRLITAEDGKFKINDYYGAINDYNTAIELNPEDHGAYTSRGSAKEELHDYRGAISDYAKAIEINPKGDGFSILYFTKGKAELIIGKENACLDFSKAGELGWTEAYEWIKMYCQ